MDTQDVRIALGATVLDAKRPGWDAEIDLTVLDLANFEVCLMGQLYGGYGAGLRALGLDLDAAIACGLDTDSEPDNRPLPRYAALTEGWTAFILARRATA